MNPVGTGTRVLNFLIDTVLIFIIGKLWGSWYDFQVMFYGFKPLAPYLPFFITLEAYYFVFEFIFNRTPGKWLTISKVISDKGKRPNVLQMLIRTLSRLILIDCFFMPFLNGKTLHDYLSKTRVVES